MKHLSKSDLEDFNTELNTALGNIFKRYGVSYGGFKGVYKDGFYFMNVLGSDEKIQDKMAQLYVDNCSAIGLPEEWLRSNIYNPESNQHMTVVGLDPNCEEACVRLEDKDGVSYNLAPADLLRLMSS